ncbi:FadR/GntR family transcriptional regulator [Pseudodesulfovibrio piezophilus]|uniref:GntR domain protein n=1 Tax=Pseudodesulfovibrio piezophilus (strain DSM 21447 / JCM 15486 / C1TLV30) TaxID=1322246 RepID=M1WU01_PSEP2|nr:FadR/GntR family transcriptional regulator [Pseudodesulfovibrio piezophilus]CCH50057.1 GntR domain protein [Pseudodesulfovibrio piezophilus C1TLV30]
MDVKPVNRKSIYEDIVHQIRSMIDRGELAPGDKLPPERKLAELFSVSRNTVREAIKALAEQNILESRQGAGTFVCEGEQESFLTTFAGAILRKQPGLADVFEVRKLLEPEIAALAARNASQDELTRMEGVLIEQEEAMREGKPAGRLDQRLHELLAQASRNEVMLAMVVALHDDLSESRVEALQSRERQEASLAAHRAIIDAVRLGHVMQAEKAMREHLEEVEQIVLAKHD